LVKPSNRSSTFSRAGKFSAERRDGGGFAMVVGIERFGATGGASKASDNCSFAKISENNKDRCNGRSEQGKDALACAPKVLSMDA